MKMQISMSSEEMNGLKKIAEVFGGETIKTEQKSYISESANYETIVSADGSYDINLDILPDFVTAIFDFVADIGGLFSSFIETLGQRFKLDSYIELNHSTGKLTKRGEYESMTEEEARKAAERK